MRGAFSDVIWLSSAAGIKDVALVLKHFTAVFNGFCFREICDALGLVAVFI